MRTALSTPPSFKTFAAVTATLAAAFVVGLVVPVAAQDRSQCLLTPDKHAAPAPPKWINLGETVQVTLTLASSCERESTPVPVDVMLVMDQSNSMGDDSKLANAKVAARRFLEKTDMTVSRVGLVAFNETAGLFSGLTHDKALIEGKIDLLQPGGRTNISGAIDVALKELLRDPQGHEMAMIVLTDGVNTVPADPVPVAAARAKDAKVTVVTFCAGGECDPGLEPAASRPDLYFNVRDTSKLAELYAELAIRLQVNEVVALTITDVVPANMRYVDGSAVPAPTTMTKQPSGETVLVWTFAGPMPAGGITYTLQPQQVGTWPTNVEARAEIVDRKGLPGSVLFPIPQVIVKADCPPMQLEVFFLIDDSNCLAGATLNGVDSRTAIRRGVERVLDQLSLGKDTASVIGYGDTAQVFQVLTDDREAILTGVDRITMRDNTARLDLAYVEVGREMKTPRHRPGSQVLTISITDGPMMPNPGVASARATALNLLGVKHYHIAVGSIAQYPLLRGIAEPGGFWELPFGGDVITPYTEFGAIAAAMGRPAVCDPSTRLTTTPPATATATARPRTATPTAGPTREGFRIGLPWLESWR
ncbi:hypothetical protein DCC79_15190 [bacterium]|nr:MAG: hypothetical protein DCC79_15190 [bacterium]